jgi:hypothetical protein
MNIILQSQITEDVKDKYILLELDSFRMRPDQTPMPAYCILEQLSLDEMMNMKQYLDLHSNLMPNYRKRNWNYVEQAIEHLMGRWNNQLDSFYTEILTRVSKFRSQEPDDQWDGVIDRY